MNHWNYAIQELNPNELHVLSSIDSFCDVDDPHGYLRDMIDETVLNRFSIDESQAPPHELKLKVDDIAILTRSVCKRLKFTTNTRVRIVSITKNIVRVQTLGEDKVSAVNLPRFYFKVKLPWGKSYTLTRRQFPLRLAYALSINRSQGQTLVKALFDVTVPPFAHGHLNVVMSRIRLASNIGFFGLEEQYDKESSMVQTTNIVYDELLRIFHG